MELSVEFDIKLPPKLNDMLKPSRYKCAYGGRGGGKSHAFASLLILKMLEGPTRVVCLRQVQNSIKDSVKQLLVDKIDEYGLHKCFEILDQEIRGVNGSLCIFKGLQHYNAANIKSLEGFDIAFIEEAQTISEISWRLLRPTIRKPGSEIWAAFNPRFDTDAIDKFFRGPHPPQDAIIRDIQWSDNPWFPEPLRRELLNDYKADPEMARHVWGGDYEIVSEGAYYARLISNAEGEGRLRSGVYNPDKPVNTSWDLGVDDATAIWFWQDDGETATVVDYYEVSGEGAEPIVRAALPELIPNLAEAATGCAELGRDEPFNYGTHYFPHDIAARDWGAGGRSRYEIMSALGVKPIHKGAMGGPDVRIEAARRLLPNIHFVPSDRIAMGIKRLRAYRRKWNDNLQTYQGPLHDDASHAADAFGEYAVNCKISLPRPEQEFTLDDLAYTAREEDGVLVSNMSIKDYIKKKERELRRNAR